MKKKTEFIKNGFVFLLLPNEKIINKYKEVYILLSFIEIYCYFLFNKITIAF